MRPAFLLVRTYRLNAHSKGDDDRNKDEIDFFLRHDPLNVVLKDPRWSSEYRRIEAEIDAHVEASDKSILPLQEYLRDQLPRTSSARLREVRKTRTRTVQALNQGYRDTLASGAIHIGEDIHDPYGGAFKVTKGLAAAFPDSVFTTPISEAGLWVSRLGLH